MNKIKCAQCGLVNWSSQIECKRCGYLLTVQQKAAHREQFDTPQPQPVFSGALQFLTAILALASLGLLLSRVLHVIPVDMAAQVSIIFMLTGIALLILTHLWLVVRIFEQSIGWGIGSLAVPLIGLFAIAMFWEKTRRSFIGQLICLAIIYVGYGIVPPSFHE